MDGSSLIPSEQRIKGLLLAVRSSPDGEYLEAYLRYYLPWCEKALILLCRREEQSPQVVFEIADKFGSSVQVVDFVFKLWSEVETLHNLSEAVKVLVPECDVLLHADKDEFLAHPEKLPHLVAKIRAGEIDYVDAQSICRFEAGLNFFDSSECRTYEALSRMAPVRCIYGDPDHSHRGGLKCFLTRSPHVRMHWPVTWFPWDAPPTFSGDFDQEGEGWIREEERMELEHFTFSKRGFEKRTPMRFSHIGAHFDYTRRHKLLELRDPFCLAACESGFWPMANDLPEGRPICGSVLKFIVKRAQQDSVVVVAGGVWTGKMLSWLCDYATFRGKKLEVTAYDRFDSENHLGFSPEGNDPMVCRDLIFSPLLHATPWNVPNVVVGDPAESAKRHPDRSVSAVWIDGCYQDRGDFLNVVKAWIPKLAPGGLLAGCGHFPVEEAFNAFGVPHLRINEPGCDGVWITVVPSGL